MRKMVLGQKNAVDVYSALESCFIKPGMRDRWAGEMAAVQDFLTETYATRGMGLVCDFTPRIKKVYTAVFASREAMEKVLAKEETEILLFVHHPKGWDLTKADEFPPMDRGLLEEFRRKKISIFNLHVPLDVNGPYSTSVTLARAIGMRPEGGFFDYYGGPAGVIGRTQCTTADGLLRALESAIGHRARLYPYGGRKIRDGAVGVIAGGGNTIQAHEELVRKGINVLVTGVTVENEFSRAAHESARKNKISLIGGTHYSTEAFACRAMCGFFTNKLGLRAEFVEEKPGMEDL